MRRTTSSLVPLLGLGWLALVAAGCPESGPPECDCSLGYVCVEGKCYPKPCGLDKDCPLGFSCVDGFCREETPCTTDADCPNGRCVEGRCYDVECQDGQTRLCETDCGTGTESCVNGVWRGCNAPQPRDEICGDDVDNDCDGDTDENCTGCQEHDVRSCQTECGSGSEWCVTGEFTGCTAPVPFLEVCGDGIDNDCDGDTDEDCTGCEEGTTVECQTECGAGMERCEDGAWLGCDATRPHQEVCDDRDNDCDGATDEGLVRDCSTSCGQGTQACEDGSWMACSAPESCPCGQDGETDSQVCGHCGVRERTCTSGTWGEWGSCTEAGDCVPGEDETNRCGRCGTDRRVCTSACIFGPWEGCVGEGDCMPDQLDEESCGECGETRTRTCDGDCTWNDWGACSESPAKECDPAAEETRPCEMCGVERRICSSTCAWDDWGSCEDMGECEANEEDASAEGCPVGYIKRRTCDLDCTWGDFGACELGGQCVPDETESQGCGDCGTQMRTCDADGVWGDWGSCTNQGPCTPDDTDSQACGLCVAQGNCDVGICEAGIQTRTCLPNCQWDDFGACQGNVDPSVDYCGDGVDQDCNGSDEDNPDTYEWNNSCSQAAWLGEEPDMKLVFASIDVRTDNNDYFYFQGWDSIDPTERIKVWVEDIPAGVDVDVCLYQGYDNCVANNPLACSNNWDQADELIDWGESFGGNDDAEYYVRVFRIYGNSCFDGYWLTVHGLR